MQRIWATGTEHDRGPIEWIGAIGEDTTLTHVRDALVAALAYAPTIDECQTALLAVECVVYLQGGDADLHPLVHAWMNERRPAADEALRELATRVLGRVRDDSPLATWWRDTHPDGATRWLEALTAAVDRVASARRAKDPRLDPRVAPLRDDVEAALPYLRVALVPYAIDEPIATTLIAPGLSRVLYYALPDCEPFPVPADHVAAWPRDVTGEAAKRTREVTEVRQHIMEHDGFEMSVVLGSDSFTAGMATFPELFFEGPAPHGVLLGIPFAGGFVFHRILDKRWREAAVQVVEHTQNLHESSSAISTQLFWLHDGKLTAQPYQVLAGLVMISPTEEFIAVVGELANE